MSELCSVCCKYTDENYMMTSSNGWRGVLMFSLICAWVDGWANNWDAGDLRCHHAHYDVIVMDCKNGITTYVTLILRHVQSHSEFVQVTNRGQRWMSWMTPYGVNRSQCFASVKTISFSCRSKAFNAMGFLAIVVIFHFHHKQRYQYLFYLYIEKSFSIFDIVYSIVYILCDKYSFLTCFYLEVNRSRFMAPRLLDMVIVCLIRML